MKDRLLPEEKKIWLEALRSGQYKQGKGRLHNGMGQYCCLGVAQKCGLGENISNREYLTDEFLHRDIQNHLAEMNDEGRSFADIADYIERNL